MKTADKIDYFAIGKEIVEVCEAVKELTGATVTVYDASGILSRSEIYGPMCKNIVTHTCDYCRSMLEAPGGRLKCMEHHFSGKKNWVLENQYRSPHWEKCYAGLEEYGVSVAYGRFLIAVAYIGQVRYDAEPEIDADFLLDSGGKKPLELYKKLPLAEKHRIELAGKLLENALGAVMYRHIPQNEAEMYFMNMEASIAKQALVLYEYHMDHGLTVGEIARSLHVNSTYLCRKFMQEFEISLSEYIRERRLNLAKRLLREGKQSLDTIAVNVGFSDTESFKRWFHRFSGKSLNEFRKEVKGGEALSGSGRLDYVKSAKQLIETGWSENLTVQELAKKFGITSDHLTRVFKKKTGFTIYGYIQHIRLEHAKDALKHTGAPVARIAEENGFSTPSSFIAAFSRETGMTPLEYRKSE